MSRTEIIELVTYTCNIMVNNPSCDEVYAMLKNGVKIYGTRDVDSGDITLNIRRLKECL